MLCSRPRNGEDVEVDDDSDLEGFIVGDSESDGEQSGEDDSASSGAAQTATRSRAGVAAGAALTDTSINRLIPNTFVASVQTIDSNELKYFLWRVDNERQLEWYKPFCDSDESELEEDSAEADMAPASAAVPVLFIATREFYMRCTGNIVGPLKVTHCSPYDGWYVASRAACMRRA